MGGGLAGGGDGATADALGGALRLPGAAPTPPASAKPGDVAPAQGPRPPLILELDAQSAEPAAPPAAPAARRIGHAASSVAPRATREPSVGAAEGAPSTSAPDAAGLELLFGAGAPDTAGLTPQHELQLHAPGAAVRAALALRVRLPLVASAQAVDLRVGERAIALRTGVDDGAHSLRVELPAPIDSAAATSSFDRKRRVLTVRAPLLREADVDALDPALLRSGALAASRRTAPHPTAP